MFVSNVLRLKKWPRGRFGRLFPIADYYRDYMYSIHCTLMYTFPCLLLIILFYVS